MKENSTAKRILIVDDNRDLRSVLLHRLERRFGYFIEEAESARDAVALLSKTRFDLVICDLAMPVESGLVVFYFLASIEASVRPLFVLFTGMPEIVEGRLEGLTVIAKPNFHEIDLLLEQLETSDEQAAY